MARAPSAADDNAVKGTDDGSGLPANDGNDGAPAQENGNVFYGTADDDVIFGTAGDGDASSLSFKQLQDNMNTQIRALTGGDITKERDVLSMDCWRALTELDAKAKDYEELSRKAK